MKFKLPQKSQILSSSKSTIVVVVVIYRGAKKDRIDLCFPEAFVKEATCGEERER